MHKDNTTALFRADGRPDDALEHSITFESSGSRPAFCRPRVLVLFKDRSALP